MADKATVKLVQRCLADVARHPVDHIDVYLADEVTTWHVALHYPKESPFEGGPNGSLIASDFSLYATLTFNSDFPARPPKLKFISKWINHQHLWGDRICHSLLSDDFLDFFRERQMHGTSMWNASCALSDEEGIGGMPRYLQILQEFLCSDPDYEEEQHVKYDAVSLQTDVEAQRAFRPDWFQEEHRLETSRSKESGNVASELPQEPVAETKAWGTDFFLKSSLVAGDPDSHPCFDVSIAVGRVPSLSTTMASLSKKSFTQGARSTDFGSDVMAILPYPCSRQAWTAVGSALAAEGLGQLSQIANFYRLQLPSSSQGENGDRLEAILSIVGEIWKTTCIAIVKDQGYESERAMMCFVTLHFLLLCFADEFEGLRTHAESTAKEFLHLVEKEPQRNLKSCVPDLGRFIVRFLLAEHSLTLKEHMPIVVRELFSRNVRWVDPDFWPDAESTDAEKEQEIAASFEASQFGMKLTVFQSYYILRSKELGLDNVAALEACCGRPALDALKAFQEDCRGIKEMGSYTEFFLWLQLDGFLDRDLHEMLCEAVDEADERGYNVGVPGR